MKTTNYHLFPTPVITYHHQPLTTKEQNFINQKLEQLRHNTGNSTTKENYILDHPQLANLKNFCNKAIHHYGQTIMQVKDGNPRITQSWANISTKGQWHHLHTHGNSLWSGVYYVETGPTDRIVFHRDYLRTGSFVLTPHEWNNINSPTWWIPSITNTLVLFPSVLAHSVPPTESKRRISISFNTFPTTSIGSENDLAYLPLNYPPTP
jgi:uncharacterized protein (TIGR02466 family)